MAHNALQAPAMGQLIRSLVFAAFIIGGFIGCAAAGPPPDARPVAGGPNAYLHPMSYADKASDVAARLRDTVVGIPHSDAMMAICAVPGYEGAKMRAQFVQEGGAVQFDRGLTVRAELAPTADDAGYPVAIRAASGLAAYVCTQELEPSDAPIP